MDFNVVETTPNINNTFGPRTANGYSAMVSQEILQRRQEPWKWGGYWLAIRIWQWPIERIVKADPPVRICWRTQLGLFYSHAAFEANCKGEKAR